MENKSTQQEILLMTGTSFASRQWNEIDETGERKNLTEIEQLEQACWNGLLQYALPELYEETEGAKKRYLWQIREATSFLELELGEFPQDTDHYFSIDPYSFMKERSNN